jgi:hypothetical protein
MRLCSVDGCERQLLARGMCRRHYERDRYVKKPSDRGPLEERFWRKVVKGPTEDHCWSWTGAKTVAGYASIWGGSAIQKPIPAHRVSYELHHGVIPSGMVVMHSCDNPECSNPRHLSLGTHHLNALDKVQKQRHEFGSNRYNAKLTEDDVRFIRSNPSIRVADLTRMFSVSQAVISNVRAGKTWKHVL